MMLTRVFFLGLEWGIKGLDSQLISTTPTWDPYMSPSLSFFVFVNRVVNPYFLNLCRRVVS